MTTNEQIAKVMGWKYCGGYFVIGKKYYTMTNKFFEMYIVKALQQRMVEDGWNIHIIHQANGLFLISAFKLIGGRVQPDKIVHATEPAAIVSLFCAVYGIEVER